MKQNIELIKRNIIGIISPLFDNSFSPSAAKNQENSVRDVVQLSQSQIIPISEAIQLVHHNK